MKRVVRSPPEGFPTIRLPRRVTPPLASSREVARPSGVASDGRSARMGSALPANAGLLRPVAGFPSSAVTAPRLVEAVSPSWTSAPLRSMTEPTASCLAADALSRVPIPSALAEPGSDWRRVYQTRLCCVFRVSHPLDALLLPIPPDRLSGRNAPGIHPSKVSPSTAGACLSAGLACLTSARAAPAAPPPATSPVFQALLSVEVRCLLAADAAGVARSSLGLPPPPGVFTFRDGAFRSPPPASLEPSGRSLPSPAPRSLYRGGPGSSPRRSPPLLGFLHLVPFGCRCRTSSFIFG
jgi:hypothetical protein